MEAMIDAGVHFGFPRAVATKLVQQTVKGTAIYAMSPEVGPADANFA
jgi:pyrroline-5-carboxylate reductase